MFLFITPTLSKSPSVPSIRQVGGSSKPPLKITMDIMEIEKLIEEIREAEKARGEAIKISPLIRAYETNKNYWDFIREAKDYLWFDDYKR